MLSFTSKARPLAALALAAGLAAPLAAQERGENINGFVTQVEGRNVVVKNDDGREIRVTVSPSTELYFQDSGDRKLFPNPTIDDLRAGMGVHFNYNDGRPDRIVVHFVPAGFVRSAPTPAPAARTETVRGRIQSIDRLQRELTARVDGRTRTFALKDRMLARDFRAGDMVELKVEDDGSRQVVTEITAADLRGVVRRVDARRGTVTITVNGRDETYDVDNQKLLDAIREGDRVRFEVEERGGRRVITDVEQLARRRY